ncbi:XdhC family protein [Aeromicrobium sp. CF4.19]|uniref:XdhC family protein n=1 Tax=Aeromicrobium sp. CF4.19 TaxID=3373082 RepID=UPI003EE5A78D
MAVADDVLASTASWSAEAPVALATVTAVSGSAPRTPGASMVVSTDGRVAGSVSSGCVEAAVFAQAQECLTSGEPTVLTFGVASDDAFEIGLTCGGRIEVFTQRLTAADGLDRLGAQVAAGDHVAVVTVLEHPDPAAIGTRLTIRPGEMTPGAPSPTVSRRLVRSLADRAEAMLSVGTDGQVRCGPDGSPLGEGVRAFVQVWSPPPRLLVFGAIDFAGALAGAGRFLGYDVTICDPRAVFATAERFPQAHRVVVDWPHRFIEQEEAAGRIDSRTAICVLTHDGRFDVPALERALRLPRVGYVGVMGSRRTHDDRLARLRAAGITDLQLAQLRSPLGLDLGGRTPEETALSIVAELVADRRGGSGRRLGELRGPIHGLDDTADDVLDADAASA